MKNYLFICQHNFIRSRYGAEFFRGMLKGKKREGKVYSAGLGIISIFLGKRVSKRLLNKMDWIFVMENYMRDYLLKKFKIDNKKIIVLNIKDIYGPGKSKDVDDLDKSLKIKTLRSICKMVEEDFALEHVRLVKNTEIYKNCTNIVIGKGNENADILFVGEAPGRNEDLQGIPFVGAAGKNLDKLLAKVGLSLDDIYVANILKCRPPENRNPLPEEIRAHTPWLIEQIKQIKPKVICSLGNYATKFFLSQGDIENMDKQPGITTVHGKVRFVEINGMKIKLIPLFHPAAIIYKRALLPLWEEDMGIVKKEIEESVEQKKLSDQY